MSRLGRNAAAKSSISSKAKAMLGMAGLAGAGALAHHYDMFAPKIIAKQLASEGVSPSTVAKITDSASPAVEVNAKKTLSKGYSGGVNKQIRKGITNKLTMDKIPRAKINTSDVKKAVKQISELLPRSGISSDTDRALKQIYGNVSEFASPKGANLTRAGSKANSIVKDMLSHPALEEQRVTRQINELLSEYGDEFGKDSYTVEGLKSNLSRASSKVLSPYTGSKVIADYEIPTSVQLREDIEDPVFQLLRIRNYMAGTGASMSSINRINELLDSHLRVLEELPSDDVAQLSQAIGYNNPVALRNLAEGHLFGWDRNSWGPGANSSNLPIQPSGHIINRAPTSHSWRLDGIGDILYSNTFGDSMNKPPLKHDLDF